MDPSKQRHDLFCSIYDQNSQGKHLERSIKKMKTEIDILREEFQFIRDDHDLNTPPEDLTKTKEWAIALAKKYHAQLYKEYALVDLSRWTESKIGMKWRTESQVLEGKGQFSCGNIHCSEARNLKAFEVPFHYMEQGKKKVALVKVVVCPICENKLNSKKDPFGKKEMEEKKEEEQKEKKERKEKGEKERKEKGEKERKEKGEKEKKEKRDKKKRKEKGHRREKKIKEQREQKEKGEKEKKKKKEKKEK